MILCKMKTTPISSISCTRHKWNKNTGHKKYSLHCEAVNKKISSIAPLSSPSLEGITELVTVNAAGRDKFDESDITMMNFGLDFMPPYPATMNKHNISYNEPLLKDQHKECCYLVRKNM